MHGINNVIIISTTGWTDLLMHPISLLHRSIGDLQFRLNVDDHTFATGATLTKLDDNGRDSLIAFSSKNMSSAEQNYTADDRELLGIVKELRRFRCYREGSSFTGFKDNKGSMF